MHSHPFRTWPLTFVLIALGVLCAGLPGQAAPRLAQARSAAASPRTIAVPAGADLQMAIDRAAPGDVLALAPGATYTGPITLPRKAGDAWIVIKTAAPEAEFPAAGRRVSPGDARLMPRIVTGGGPAIVAAPGAHHYRFVGIEIAPKDGVSVTNLVELSSRATSVEALPHHIAFERCYLHGDKAKGSRRGIALECAGCRDRRLALLRLQGGRRGIPGDRRLERAGALQHRQQLPGGGGRERDVRRRRSVHPGPRAVGHRDPPESHRQAAHVEGRRAGLRGQGVGGEEPARAQERAPRGHRGQSPRGQLAPGAERLRRALHGAEPGRRGAVVDRRGRHVRQQHRPAHRLGDQYPRARRRAAEPGRAAHRDQEQRVRGRRRPALGRRRHALSDPERPVPGRHREQHRAADRQHHHRRRAAPGRLRLPPQHRSRTTPTASSAPAPARGRERSRSISPARSSRAT